MTRFFIGFFSACVIWSFLFYLQFSGAFDVASALGMVSAESSSVADAGQTPNPTDGNLADGKKGRRMRKNRRDQRRQFRASAAAKRTSERYDMDTGYAGDDLNTFEGRELQLDRRGGEEQLSNAEIERGIDGVFQGIRRCLILVPGDAPLIGTLVVGMTIANTGRISQVNLKGPKVMIEGESGACLRRNVQSIQYPSFDGPDMVAHYPIEFE